MRSLALRIALLSLAFAGVPVAGAEEAAPAPAATAPAEPPKPQPAAAEEPIGPLDEWSVPQPEPSTTTTVSSSSTTSTDAVSGGSGVRPMVQAPIVESYAPDVFPKEEPRVITAPARELVVPLNRRQEARLVKARARRHWRLRRQREAINARMLRDGRGEPEVRVCSLNLETFGEKKAVERITRKKTAGPKVKRLTRKALDALVQGRCHVAALQGIVSGDHRSAQQALDDLAKKLSERTDSKWRAMAVETGDAITRLGFLIGNDLPLLGVVTYTDRVLARMGDFQAKKFARAPAELWLSIPGKEGKPQRKLAILNFDLQTTVARASSEPDEPRMQMADTIRQIAVQSLHRQAESADVSDVILVVTGNLATLPASPSVQLLEGGFRLEDFGPKGECRLEILDSEKEAEESPEEGEKVVKPAARKPPVKVAKCEEIPQHPRVLFNPLSILPAEPKRFKEKEKDGEKTWVPVKASEEDREREAIRAAARKLFRSALYLFPNDLEFLRGTQWPNRGYLAGAVPFEKQTDSALLWAEFNW